MTYLVGWKRGGAAFLCADSMVTNPPRVWHESLSSFGEQHVNDGKRRVQEGALKIFNLGPIAIGIAGIAERGIEIAEDVAISIEAGVDPREAFLRAVDRSPERSRGVHLMAVVAEDPAALLFYRGSGPVEEVPEDHSAHGGNIDAGSKIYADLLTASLQLLASSSFSAEELLVCVLGYVQGLCTQHLLVEKYGIGGSWTGLYAEKGRIHWQPDLLHAVSAREKWVREEPPDFVATVVRENVAIIKSTFLTRTLLFGAAVSRETYDRVRESWAPDSDFSRVADGPFDYINIVDTQLWSLAVLQMKRQMETRDVRLRVRRIVEGARGMALDMTNEFLRGLTRPLTAPQPDPGNTLMAHGSFVFREYRPPDRPWPEVVPPEKLLQLSDVLPLLENKKPAP